MTTTKNKSKDVGENNILDKIPETVTFHYIKGVDFRSVHVDGAFGGLTAKGFLHIALFSERTVIPQETTFKITSDGLLGDEVKEKRVSKEGIVRQLEVDIIVNEQTAIDLRAWLDQKIDEFQKRKKVLQTLKSSSDKRSH